MPRPRLRSLLPMTAIPILLFACYLPGATPAPEPLLAPTAAAGETTTRGILTIRTALVEPTLKRPADLSDATDTPAPPAADSPTEAPVDTLPAARTPPTIDDFLARCPTTDEIAALRADFNLAFETDPTAGALVCRAADGSADLTALQKRAYQTVLLMRFLAFDAPLPWTNRSLYAWFAATIRAIRFRADIDYSYCCEPADTINILVQPNSYLMLTDRWVDPALGGGLMDTMVLYVHEARHNEGYGHTCHEGRDDRTVAEMGAWGVQYRLLEWLAQHADRASLRASGADPDLYRRAALDGAFAVRRERFCDEPALTPGATPTLAP